MTERTYTSLTELIDCLTAARTLGFKNVTVTSHFQPAFQSDTTRLPSKWEYRVSLTEEDRIAVRLPDGTTMTDSEYAGLFANDPGPMHLHLGVSDCQECA